MTSVVINADDFGLSDGICRSIRELLDSDAASNTTLMMAADGSRTRMKNWGVQELLGVAGVHLQLTSGVPLSPAKEIPTLVNPKTGRFWAREEIGRVEPSEVALEWSRQIELANEALGGSPTHIDSHRGVSRIPECIPVFVELASRYALEVRGHPGETEALMKQKGVTGSVSVIREWTGRNLDAHVLMEMVENKASQGADLIEIVTHPGYSDAYLESVSGLSTARDGDHRVLLELLEAGWPESHGYRRGAFTRAR
ncbi:carbohydrate deacetylase [Streptomyces sp. T028]|uniref:carbohydrate deacetylase n=1 Tax=Streptomyces sp. T028 TaxID=3394379 RepID=UPI003A890E5F